MQSAVVTCFRFALGVCRAFSSFAVSFWSFPAPGVRSFLSFLSFDCLPFFVFLSFDFLPFFLLAFFFFLLFFFSDCCWMRRYYLSLMNSRLSSRLPIRWIHSSLSSGSVNHRFQHLRNPPNMFVLLFLSCSVSNCFRTNDSAVSVHLSKVLIR